MKIKHIEKVEYYFITSENNHLYRKPVNGNKEHWEWLNNGNWVKVEDNDIVEEAFNDKLNNDN
jgi:hypothetical protein